MNDGMQSRRAGTGHMHELAYNIKMRHKADESVGMAAMNQPATIICLLPSPLTAERAQQPTPSVGVRGAQSIIIEPCQFSYCKLKLLPHHDIFLCITSSRRAARPFLSDHHNPNLDGFNFNAPVLISISSMCLRYHHDRCCF